MMQYMQMLRDFRRHQALSVQLLVDAMFLLMMFCCVEVIFLFLFCLRLLLIIRHVLLSLLDIRIVNMLHWHICNVEGVRVKQRVSFNLWSVSSNFGKN